MSFLKGDSMKTRLLGKLRREAYNHVKIDEERFISGESYFEICLYNELYRWQKEVFNVNNKYFEPKEYSNIKNLGCKIFGLDSAIHWLNEARRVYILQKVKKMKSEIEAKRERVKKQEREDYLHSF
jgi:hypothetical protein